MDRIGRPRGLIAYDTMAKRQSAMAGIAHEPLRLIRPRTMLYAAALALVGLVMLVAWANRTVLELNVLADRNPAFVVLSGGGVRNGYTAKILNKLHEPREYVLSLRDLPGATFSILGFDSPETARIRVATDVLREIRVFVTVPPGEAARSDRASRPFLFVIRDARSGAEVTRTATFQGLGQGPGVNSERRP
jgi:polyferredoxin